MKRVVGSVFVGMACCWGPGVRRRRRGGSLRLSAKAGGYHVLCLFRTDALPCWSCRYQRAGSGRIDVGADAGRRE